jgi:hypothetical protein
VKETSVKNTCISQLSLINSIYREVNVARNKRFMDCMGVDLYLTRYTSIEYYNKCDLRVLLSHCTHLKFGTR